MKLMKKGFTLIELLVTIAIVGVLAAAVLVAINPTDKINAANDSRVLADMGQVATALNAYTASNNGNYPAAANWSALMTALTGSGDLSAAPAAPSGRTYAGSTTATSGVIYSTLSSTRWTAKCTTAGATAYAFWSTTATTGSGAVCGYCNTAAATPTSALVGCSGGVGGANGTYIQF